MKPVPGPTSNKRHLAAAKRRTDPDYDDEDRDRSGYTIEVRNLAVPGTQISYTLVRNEDWKGLGAYGTWREIDAAIDTDRGL